jgi:hypothetical protein
MNFRNRTLKLAIQDTTVCNSARSCRFTPGFRPVVHQIDGAHLTPRIWIREAKRKSTVSMMDLPQGILPMTKMDLFDVGEEPAYPTVVQQARNNMRKFSHCVVLTRVGSFYEVISSSSPLAVKLLKTRSSSISSRLKNTRPFSI